jgi:heme O synthase-like polyprenyltransferase
MGTLIFGLWLVANRDYKFFSFWILAAIVLWVVGTATGERVMKVEDRGQATRLFWISSLALFLMLVLMIFKPGA